MLRNLRTAFIFLHCAAVFSLNQYFEEGSNAILNCTANTTNVPSSQVWWVGPPDFFKYSQGERINPYINNTIKYRLSIIGNHSYGEFNLNITNLQKSDEGAYRCMAGTSDRGDTIIVLVKVLLTYVEIVPRGPIDMSVLEIKTFECTATSLPIATVKWYLDSSLKPETSNSSDGDTVTSRFIYNAAKDDNGKVIYCVASSVGDSVQSGNATLNITYGPTNSLVFVPSDTSIEKIKGEKLEPIRCSAVCNPPCQYEWSNVSQVVEHGDTLYIHSLKKTDHGRYRCTAWNSFGNANMDLMITVNYGPADLNLSPDNTSYTLIEFSSLQVITCNADCRPDCIKYWIGPNTQIIQSENFSINSIHRLEAGTYTCYVNNTVNFSTSPDVKVNVVYGPTNTLIFVPSETTIEKIKGEKLDPVRCSAVCHPLCQYEWSKDSQVVEQGDTLHMHSLKKTDHGRYRCKAWNSFGNATMDLTITVNYGPEKTSIIPDKYTYTLEESDALPAILCSTSCRPTCNIYWIGPSNKITFSDTLNIDGIYRSDAGHYQCYTNNTVNSSISKSVTVVVNYGASVSSLEISDGSFTVNEKQSVNMTCHVEGVPKPKIIWTFDGNILSTFENQTNYVFTSSCKNTGNYSCGVINYLAEMNLTKQLYVNCYPRIVPDKSTNDRIGLKDGEGINITVSLIAYPKPVIEWFFKNSSIMVNNSFGIFQHNSYLFKQALEQDDFGVYDMFIENTVGRRTYFFTVDAERRPDPPVVISANCTQFTMMVFWIARFDGGDRQFFFAKARNSISNEEQYSEMKEDVEVNLNTTIKGLRPGTLYYVVVTAENSHGTTTSDGIANCTTDPSKSESFNIIAVAAGAGTGSAIIVLGIVIVFVFILQRRAVSKKNQNDKEPFQSHQHDEDDGVSSGSVVLSTKTGSSGENSKVLKQKKNEMQKKDIDVIKKPQQKEKKGKENKAIELGCVYENAADLVEQEEKICANDNNEKDISQEHSPHTNKDGLIYADLDLAPVSAGRRFIIHELENKSNYAIIDLSKTADPLPSDEEENEREINISRIIPSSLPEKET